MSSPDTATINHILQNGPHKSEVGRKQLTLALGGHYIASTTLSAKPFLVWESEKGYARYYLPVESLHNDIRKSLSHLDAAPNKEVNGQAAINIPVTVDVVERFQVKGKHTQALVEKVTVGSRSTTWVRFVEGELKGLIRFERSEIGKPISYTNLTTRSGEGTI